MDEIAVDEFYEDPDTQEFYRTRINELRNWLMKSYQDEYSDAIMLQQVKGIVRAEIQIERLEAMIANEMDGPETNMQLTRERNHLQVLRQNLRMHLRQLRPESYNVKHTLDKDFTKYAEQMLMEEMDADD